METIGYFYALGQPAVAGTLRESGRLSNMNTFMIEYIASAIFDMGFYTSTGRGYLITERNLDRAIEFMENQLALYK